MIRARTRRAWLASGMLTSALAWAQATELSPKLLIRTGGGEVYNTVNHKSTFVLGGFNVVGHWYLTDWLSAGLAFRADFDFARRTLPLKGFDVQGRAYFYGSATQQRIEEIGDYARSGRRALGLYALGEFAQRSYLFRRNESADLTGTLGMINFGLGADFALSRHFEWNLEASTTAYGFSSDPRNVQLKVLLFTSGLGYVF